MKKIIISRHKLILLIFSLLLLYSCDKREEVTGCFPTSYINVVLNLNLPTYQNLAIVGGWSYVDEQNSGSKGLIVVRTNGGFKVYDRNAPHLCPDNSTTLSVVDNIKIVCPKDNATWILLTGEPTAVSQVPPKNYFYEYNSNSNTLTIHN